MSATPLAGLRVLDLSKVLAGPLCAQYLGDMGADVIKIETLVDGDETRHWPPFRADLPGNGSAPADSAPTGRMAAEDPPPEDVTLTGTVFLSANRNKRSLAVDLRSASGLAVIHRLAQKADVVVESFGPGAAARLGVDAPTLRALNPRLVCCNISGFGSVGPMRDGKGYDVILQAFCGMLAITGERDGPPVRSPFSPVDQATGLHALIGIQAALLERAHTGVGSTVEASLFDSATGYLGYFLQGYWERGTEPQRPGSGHESLCPYEAFATADKPLILGVANDKLWRAFCKIAGLEDIVDDARFRTNAARVRHRDETVALVRRALSVRKRDQWIADLAEVGIPCSPLHTLGELSAHPHTRASGMVFDYEDPHRGTMHGVAQPIRFDGARPALRRPPPGHGEHGREILIESGFSEVEIAAMARAGVVRLGVGR